MAFFSVIIPLYNKEEYILSTLESIKKQTFKDFEIIVIDDGSTDSSYEFASNFETENITLLKQENHGVSTARNKGINLAKGKYIALLDADDTWYPNHLKELKKQIDKFPEAKLFCNNYEVLFSKTKKRNASFNFNYSESCLIVEDYFYSSIIDSVAWSSAVAFSKETFLEIGQFNQNLITCEDLDFWIRIALKYKVSFNPNITMSYKTYLKDSLTKNEDNLLRERFINSFKEEESKNKSLKFYLDINRYALVIRTKLTQEKELGARVASQILKENLNFKQRLLLKSPSQVIKTLKKIQMFLSKKGLYLTAFK